MNKVSLNKIRKMQLGGSTWQQLGNQQIQNAFGGYYNGRNAYTEPVLSRTYYPSALPTINVGNVPQGSLNGNPFKVKLNDQVQQNIKDYQQSTVDAMVKQQQHQQNLAKLNNVAGTVGKFADMASMFLPQNSTYNGSYGHLAQGIDNLGNTASDMVMSINPLIGGIMKGGMLLGKGLSAIGLGTDGMTWQDSLLNNNVMNATPMGMLNAAFGKRSHNLDINKETEETVGSDYTDTYQDVYKAKEKANKKYGLFSTGARHKANRFIDRMNNYQDVMTGISDNAQRVLAQSTDANIMRYNLGQNGGVKQQYLRVARIGAKLPKIKDKIEWKPVITIDNPIKLEKGGKTTRTLKQLIAYAKEQNPRFIQRMSEPLRYITLPNGQKATHKMSWATATFDNGEQPFIYSEIQEDDNGELKDFGKDAAKRALDKKNYLLVNNPEEAELFTNSNDLEHGYKSGWKDFFTPFYKDGGNVTIQVTVVKESKEESKQEEPKNVIPAGALHAHKHHMDNADSLTQKGIPVVDDKGEQQAEIEKDEIILHLKLTNKLEELQEKYEKASKTEQDKLAIEAGKLLVEEILHNTIDNTNLIDKCKEGGKLNGSI